jgi:hypothetical protein
MTMLAPFTEEFPLGSGVANQIQFFFADGDHGCRTNRDHLAAQYWGKKELARTQN